MKIITHHPFPFPLSPPPPQKTENKKGKKELIDQFY